MHRVRAKFVSRILTKDQMENKKFIVAELFKQLTNENDFLSKIVTGDETLVFAYDPETKLQPSEWHTKISPRIKKFSCYQITIEGRDDCIFRQRRINSPVICTK